MSAGWNTNRDVWQSLEFTEEKNIFLAFREIATNFAHLKIEFIGKSGAETLYFDLDESKKGKDLKANTFNYPSSLDKEWVSDPDYMETEDFKETAEIEQQIKQKCARIGFWNEYLGMDLYVGEDGKIYISHYYDASLYADNIVELINKVIVNA